MKKQFWIFSQKSINIFQKISKIIIYCLVFFIPLFFLPLTTDTLDFNKQILLIFLSFIAFLFWFLSNLSSQKYKFRLSLLSIVILVFLFVFAFSTFFSQWPFGSFYGFPLNVSQSFLSLCFFILFYFLVINIFFDKKDIFWLLCLFVISGGLAVFLSLFQILQKFLNFNPIGSFQSVAFFVVFLLPLIIPLIFKNKKKFITFVLIICVISFIFYLLLIDLTPAWVVLIAGSAPLLIFSLFNIRQKQSFYLIVFSTFLLVLGLFFLIFNTPFSQVQFEISPSYKTEIKVAKNVLFKKPFLGTGPSTFLFDYSKFKPIEIYNTSFWNIKFTKGAAEILDILITTGILGLLSLIFIFVIVLYFSLKFFKNTQKDWLLSLGIFSSFLVLMFVYFLHSTNFILSFSFWFILSLSDIFFLENKIKKRSISPLKFIASNVLLLILFLGLSLFAFKFYLAEIYYTQGIKNWRQDDLELAIRYIKKATNLNPHLDLYWRDLSQLYSQKFQQTLKQDSSLEKTKDYINLALNTSRQAIKISPINVINWQVLASIYDNLTGITQGAEEFALSNYQKALELDPQNPYFLTQIGRVFLYKAELAQNLQDKKALQTNLDLAKRYFQDALKVKPDYVPAHFQIAQVLLKEGKVKEAIQKLEQTKLIAPFDINLAFQLGFLYYNTNQLDLAKEEFERILAINENRFDARYFLGLIYDQEGEKERAIEQFEKILKFNPDNSQVKKILENLKKGLPALEGF